MMAYKLKPGPFAPGHLTGHDPLPPAYGMCHCDCHRLHGVKHCVPCCYPTDGPSMVPPPNVPTLFGVPPDPKDGPQLFDIGMIMGHKISRPS